MKNKDSILPSVKNVPAKTLAEDLFPYIHGDKENQKIWDKILGDFRDSLEESFRKKGIPMPKIIIDYTKEKIKPIKHE